uniref:Autophagy-related protein 14 n=1 Tax=Steinernema glaseri TaxID=37863 RepID=A0A1I8AH36_9BILA
MQMYPLQYYHPVPAEGQKHRIALRSKVLEHQISAILQIVGTIPSGYLIGNIFLEKLRSGDRCKVLLSLIENCVEFLSSVIPTDLQIVFHNYTTHFEVVSNYLNALSLCLGFVAGERRTVEHPTRADASTSTDGEVETNSQGQHGEEGLEAHHLVNDLIALDDEILNLTAEKQDMQNELMKVQQEAELKMNRMKSDLDVLKGDNKMLEELLLKSNEERETVKAALEEEKRAFLASVNFFDEEEYYDPVPKNARFRLNPNFYCAQEIIINPHNGKLIYNRSKHPLNYEDTKKLHENLQAVIEIQDILRISRKRTYNQRICGFLDLSELSDEDSENELDSLDDQSSEESYEDSNVECDESFHECASCDKE